MQVYDLQPVSDQYQGCGKAWAAIVDGRVVAIRYMEDMSPRTTKRPDWVEAIDCNAEGLDDYCLPTAWSSYGLAKLARAAEACTDCPTPPRRSRYRPSELLAMARDVLAEIDHADFGVYRNKCRAELGKLGEVVSGMASCYELCV